MSEISAEAPAKCHHCHWEGKVKDLLTIPVPDPIVKGVSMSHPYPFRKEQACPSCYQYDEIEIKE